MQKIKQQVCLNPQLFIKVVRYMQEKNIKNTSKGLETLISLGVDREQFAENVTYKLNKIIQELTAKNQELMNKIKEMEKNDKKQGKN